MEDLEISLPCGFTIGLKEFKNNEEKFNCPVCKTHEICLRECMEITRNKLIFGQAELKIEEANLAACSKELEIYKNDPIFYIDESLAKAKNKLDLRREELKLKMNKEIDKCYNDSLKEIERLKQSKLDHFEKNMEIINSCELKMEKLKKQQDSNIVTKLDLIKDCQSLVENTIFIINTSIDDLKKQLDFTEPYEEINLKQLFGKVSLHEKAFTFGNVDNIFCFGTNPRLISKRRIQYEKKNLIKI